MSLVLTQTALLALAVLLFVAGAINGLAGFGFALVGTMVLATAVDPTIAVVFMILPILAVNLSLVSELSTEELRTCSRRFAPLLLSALVGTLIGMMIIDVLPENLLRVALGVVALGFVASTQTVVPVPGLGRTREGCFVESMPAMVGVGGISGVLFGGTNVGVQLVAYLKSCDLSHGLFVGVIAMIFLGLNAIRVGAAGVLGLYPDMQTVGLSVAAAIPAVAGVALGTRLRVRVTERMRRALVLGLLTVIGGRLIADGAGLVG